MDLGESQWTQFLWEQFGECVLGHLRKTSRDFTRDVHALRCVHSQWRRGILPCLDNLSPRLRFLRSLPECVEELAMFPATRSLTLPPLRLATAVDFPFLGIQSQCESLTLRQEEGAFAADAILSVFPSLKALSVEGGVGHANFLDSIAAMSHLETLELKDLEIEGDVREAFLSRVTSQIRRLVVDNCFKLTSPGLHPIRDFVHIRELILGLDSVKETDIKALCQCGGGRAEISLILYGERKLSELQLLTNLSNLKSLNLQNSQIARIPTPVREMVGLTSLTFSTDTSICLRSANDVGNLPYSLLSMSMSLRCSSPFYLEHFIRYAQRLMRLKLVVPLLTKNIPLHSCCNLTELDISAKECDGEVLENVARCAKLEKLRIGGFLLLKGIHLRHLASLCNLREFSICSSILSRSGYEELSKLSCVESLSFYLCPTLNPAEFYEMSHLRCMSFGYCITVERNLASLLERPFISNLNFIGFKFCCAKAIPPSLKEFAERVVTISVDPYISLPQ